MFFLTTASRWQSKHALAEIRSLSLVGQRLLALGSFGADFTRRPLAGPQLTVGYQDTALGALDTHPPYTFSAPHSVYAQRLVWTERCYFMSQ